MKSTKEILIEELKRRSVRWGEFTLSSGRKSDFYVDCRTTTLSGDGLPLIARLLLHELDLYEAGHDANIEYVAGLTLGADPIIAALVMEQGLDGLIVRKAGKDHGTKKLVEGMVEENLDGALVMIVDDVITTGESSLLAARAIEAVGGKIAFIGAVVDREEGGKENIQAAGYEVRALVTRTDLMETAPKQESA